MFRAGLFTDSDRSRKATKLAESESTLGFAGVDGDQPRRFRAANAKAGPTSNIFARLISNVVSEGDTCGILPVGSARRGFTWLLCAGHESELWAHVPPRVSVLMRFATMRASLR